MGLGLLASLAMCGDDAAPVDGSVDGGADGGASDSGADAEVDARAPVDAEPSPRDAFVDAPAGDGGPVDGGVAGWRAVPGLPASCDLQYAERPESVLEEIRWAPCPDGSGECEVLSVELGRRVERQIVSFTGYGANGAREPSFLIGEDDGSRLAQLQLVRAEGPSVLAAWRYTSALDNCGLGQVTTSDRELGFEVGLPGNESRLYRTPLAALPAMPESPFATLTVEEQPGAVAIQDMRLSPEAFGVVLQPGGVLWLFDEDTRIRRGGPLEPGVPGAVINDFALVGTRVFWGTGRQIVSAPTLEGPSEAWFEAAEGWFMNSIAADDEFVVWALANDDREGELWAGAVAEAASDFAPERVDRLPSSNPASLGEGLVAVYAVDPDRVLLFDLRGGPTRSWNLPDGWLGATTFVWVNRRDVGLIATRTTVSMATVFRVPLSSFDPL
ncbi:MAG: hypothetical protein CMN31_09100 [Sandaracinus sp.]|nr:hypothetical protein [Myxococcales bacterium]MAT24528.1 hypothetical protein [Sandaracinus sp.]HJK92997.1 hypothetical protein [Polyangiaceae bacterium LLY-WYZ-15_(1-7)]MBJ71484.1 hypothetical protein [Sandaracinus sp.]HJL35967.1 hypothetical protein [Polyangiaceae bacterium LLY-WYZ-15_(1-7)]